MLDIADDLSVFTLAAGEPFVIDLVLQAADGAAEALTGRGFALTFHDDERRVVAGIDGVAASDATGTFIRFMADGRLSERLYGQPLAVELAERLQQGRDVLARGRLSVTLSAADAALRTDGTNARWVQRVTLRTAGDGTRTPGVVRRPFAAVAVVQPATPVGLTLSAGVSMAEGDDGVRRYTYTVTRSVTNGAIAIPWTFAAGQTDAADYAGGVLPAGGTVQLADGVASGSFTVEVAGDRTVEPDEGFTVAITSPAGYVATGATSATGVILNDDVATLAGFAMNGAANTVLRAAVDRVRAGTGRGRIVWKGDSITVGQGAGTGADPFYLTGARARRIPAMLAASLSAGGTPTLDAGFVADHAIHSATGRDLLAAFDPRIGFVETPGASWNVQPAAGLAGGGYWQPGSNRLTFTPETDVDTFEIVAFRSNSETYRIAIDDAPPVSGAASLSTTAGGGFVRHLVKAAASGRHRLALWADGVMGAFRSVIAYREGAAGFDMIVHAALGSQSGNQAASGSGWSNMEALAFDAPDLTIVLLGLNDMNVGTPTADYARNLKTIVDGARASGDVLLVFPPPAAGNYNRDVALYRDAAAGVAAIAGVAFLSLYDYYGPFSTVIAARMADGLVHPDAAFAADIAGVIGQALRRMAPKIG